MLYRLIILFGAVFSLSFASVGNARTETVSTDSLVALSHILHANGWPDSAETILRRVLDVDANSAQAMGRLGWIRAEQGRNDEANELFDRAEALDPRTGYRAFGDGVIAFHGKKYPVAREAFDRVRETNPLYADALLFNVYIIQRGLGERSLLMLAFDGILQTDQLRLSRMIERAIRANPRHPTAYREMGHLRRSLRRIDEAIRLYEQQLEVNPKNGETLKALGLALMETGRYWHARQRLFTALTESGRTETLGLTLALAATYLEDRQLNVAQDYYSQAFQMMSDEERSYYEDISRVGTADEAAAVRNLSEEETAQYLRRFWLRRDPTPVTQVNERLLEHFRRVWYSRLYYSRGKTPWDDRGEVYIRYGKPEHISSSAFPNFESSHDVDQVRERYLRGIYGSRAPDELLTGNMPIYPLVDPQFYRSESNRSSMGADQFFDYFQNRDFGADRTEAEDMSARFGRDAGSTANIRWETWTYTNIGSGFVFTFVDRFGTGEFRFAEPPPTGDANLISTLEHYAPAQQFAFAQQSSPEHFAYTTTQQPLNFSFYTAQFRQDDDRTQVDVYYDIPVNELVFRERRHGSGYEAIVESGVAVFDSAWNVLVRSKDPMSFIAPERPAADVGMRQIDMRSIIMAGGGRILLSVQEQDALSGRLQAYQENIDVARFDVTRLAMSDVVVAGVVRKATDEDDEKFLRNDLYVLPMASQAFRREQPMHVYFEIYNLTRGPDYGETSYEVEHSVSIKDDESGGSILGSVGRIFGGTSRSVGVGQIIEGIRASEHQHFQIDTSNLQPGEYTLTITVRDLKSDQLVSKTRRFFVWEQ